MFLLSYVWCNYSLLEPIKVRHEGISIHTHKLETMGSKELKPWSHMWVRQQLRERNNGLLPNDPNHDEKPPTNAERPFCKWDFECQSHMSSDYDTYNRRYWSCPQPTCSFHWGWDKDQPRKVVPTLTFTIRILNNVIINFLFPSRVFTLSSFHHHYMTAKNKNYVVWVEKCGAMRKGASSSK
jgi:hypothetical protein